MLACLLFPALAFAADLRLMLPRGYVVTTEGESTLGSRRSVLEVRSYTKHTDRGVSGGDRIEIAIVPGLKQGYEFALYRSPNDRILYSIKERYIRKSWMG